MRQIYSAIIPSENRISPLNSEMKMTVVAQPGIEKPNKYLSPLSLAINVSTISTKEKNEVIRPR